MLPPDTVSPKAPGGSDEKSVPLTVPITGVPVRLPDAVPMVQLYDWFGLKVVPGSEVRSTAIPATSIEPKVVTRSWTPPVVELPPEFGPAGLPALASSHE